VDGRSAGVRSPEKSSDLSSRSRKADDTGEFILDADACDKAIGAVLSQVQEGTERVIVYAGRSLDKREVNYCVTRKELLSIVYSLRYFKQYLMGRNFRIRLGYVGLLNQLDSKQDGKKSWRNMISRLSIDQGSDTPMPMRCHVIPAQ